MGQHKIPGASKGPEYKKDQQAGGSGGAMMPNGFPQGTVFQDRGKKCYIVGRGGRLERHEVRHD